METVIDILFSHTDEQLFKNYSCECVHIHGGDIINRYTYDYYEDTKRTKILGHIYSNINKLYRKVNTINIVGASKSTVASILYSKDILEKYPEANIRLFLFSPYLSLDPNRYNGMHVNGSMKRIWKLCRKRKMNQSEDMLRQADIDIATILYNTDVEMFLFLSTNDKTIPNHVFDIARTIKHTKIYHNSVFHAMISIYWYGYTKSIQKLRDYMSIFHKGKVLDLEYSKATSIYSIEYNVNFYNLLHDTDTCLSEINNNVQFVDVT